MKITHFKPLTVWRPPPLPPPPSYYFWFIGRKGRQKPWGFSHNLPQRGKCLFRRQVGISIISICKRTYKPAHRRTLCCEKDKKHSWSGVLFIWKDVAFTMVKRDAVFSLGAWKGYQYNIKGVFFLSKELYKRLRGWASGRSLAVYNSVECPSSQPHPTPVALRGSQGLNSGLREIENGSAGTRVWNGYALYHSSPENLDFGRHEVNETCRTTLLNFPAVRWSTFP